MFKKKNQYYSLKRILEKQARYNVIFGERSNGKTYAVLKHAVEEYAKTGGELAIVRRWEDDFKAKRAAQMFQNLVANGEIGKATGGEWTEVFYWSGRWYMARYEENEKGDRVLVKSDKPFAYAFSLTAMEHDKSTSYPHVTTVLFDEFMTRGYYIPNEFIVFMNVLSTIIRDRDNVKIFMCGNTVNQYCPYFEEMGLKHIKEMKQGDIDVYSYGTSGLVVAVEFSDSPAKSKPSNIYFAFDNPKLAMITGKGQVWEMEIYPHLPHKYKPKDVLYTFFICFDGSTLQCEIIQIDSDVFVYIHVKTTPLKDDPTDIIYTTEHSPKPNYSRNLLKPKTGAERRIASFFATDKIFYQDNPTGEIVRNYLNWCRKS